MIKVRFLKYDVTKRYRIDENRIYVTGLSMGGFGTWALTMAYPERFAAIAPR
jgi:predicted peptidase